MPIYSKTNNFACITRQEIESIKTTIMGKIYQSYTEIIGHTPLLEVRNIEKEKELKARIIVKLEAFNPGGSSKDRIALAKIRRASCRERV